MTGNSGFNETIRILSNDVEDGKDFATTFNAIAESARSI
jgi:hypothetical protein